MSGQSLLRARGLGLRFGTTTALADVDVDVAPGEVLAIMGASGSGKSTLLHVLAGILRPDTGEVVFEGVRLDDRTDAARASLRLRRFGFVFQFGDLVPELTLVENVALPLVLTGVRRRPAEERAREQLESLGLTEAASRRPADVSGGQQQRAAVARALVTRPTVLFADEPTGALDSLNGEEVLEAMVALARDQGSAVVLVTHEARVAAYADREMVLRDGAAAQLALVDDEGPVR